MSGFADISAFLSYKGRLTLQHLRQIPKHNIPGVLGSDNPTVKQGQIPKHNMHSVSNHSKIKCSCVKSRHRWNRYQFKSRQ